MRLLSYNIHKGIGGRDRRYRIERIIDVVEEQNPDLICLQEVDRHVPRSRFDDQPRMLGEYFHVAAQLYQMNVHLRTGGYGNLVLSRWPFLAHHQISLRNGKKKPRGAQILVVETPEGPLQLVNWHLGLAERERHWQVAHLLDHHLFCEGECYPGLIVGDFNDWRNTLAPKVFHPRGYEHITSPPSRFRSFPAYASMGSLDKAFRRGKIQVHGCHVVRTPLARRASDHLPLVIDFHLGE